MSPLANFISVPFWHSSDKITEVGQEIGLVNLGFNEHEKYNTDNFGRFHCNT